MINRLIVDRDWLCTNWAVTSRLDQSVGPADRHCLPQSHYTASMVKKIPSFQANYMAFVQKLGRYILFQMELDNFSISSDCKWFTVCVMFCFSASPPQWKSPTRILMTTWRRSPAPTLGPPTDACATGSSSALTHFLFLSVEGQSVLFDCVILLGLPTRRPTGRRWRQTTVRGTSAVQAITRAETNVSVSNYGNF